MDANLKNKLKLTFLLLITALPVSLATFSFRDAIEEGALNATVNKGHLINPPADISALAMRDLEGQPVFKTFEDEIAALAPGQEYEIKPWLMVYVNGADCDASCEDRIHYLQQLHVALGKNIQRVRRYYLNTDMAPFSEETAVHFREEYPSMGLAYTDKQTLRENMLAAGVTLDPAAQSYVLLIDPVGNVMMYYTEEHTPVEIMTDLETLLRYSSLG
jgi:hypothetical protein